MANRRHKGALTGLRCVGAIVALSLLAACAAAPPPAAPKIERVTGAVLEAGIPAPHATIGIEDIVAMAKHGESPDNIIGRIDATHSHYRLDARQISTMLTQGVATSVIDHLIASERRQLFDNMAADLARRDQACQERVEQEVRQCRLQSLPQPGVATCWPPHPGFPYWRCF